MHPTYRDPSPIEPGTPLPCADPTRDTVPVADSAGESSVPDARWD
jgi:hypothetical protein